jgi:hypothetical protein
MNKSSAQKFTIFREKDARSLHETGIMSLPDFNPAQLQGLARIHRPELSRGDNTRVLFNIPGFSLVHVWFKKDYPLPLHSHDSDCLYYVIAGSLDLGTEHLGPRDGFFVPADVPYTYNPGPEGVELLEFRHATQFNFNVLAKTEAFWKRAAETVEARNEEWKTAKMPALNV